MSASSGKAIRLEGLVQGVGFRPFVYRLALACGLVGDVRNDGHGVLIRVFGKAEALAAFEQRLFADLPAMARVFRHSSENLTEEAPPAFRIIPSETATLTAASVAPDIRICRDCLAELRDPRDRRYGYAFIACAHCGPRYTMLEALPFDREHTAMRDFPLCADCRAEYENPASRRFHAQAIACPACGPRLRLVDAAGADIAGDPLKRCAEILSAGGIVAIKGIGGFHLACNAHSEKAVARLRQRKRREAKPLAVMAANADIALSLLHINAPWQGAITALWESPEAPIVIAPKHRTDGKEPLAASVAPGCDTYGVMLPYAPLHFLLFDLCPQVLVMTSANLSDEPICIDNDEARLRLAGIADAFLLHDRRIRWRADDSVIIFAPPRPPGAAAMILARRSRGFVPRGLPVTEDVDGIVGFGPLLKNTFAVGKGRTIYLAPHIGDLDNASAQAMYEETLAHTLEVLRVKPRLAACDLHPDFPSTRLAEASGLPLIRVQHHHAHLAALLAESGEGGPSLGFACDGTGLGDDGAIWGCEVMAFDAAGYERLWHLEYVPLPGGDRAVAEPWRMAVSYLWHYGFKPERYIHESGVAEVTALLASGIAQPRASSLGRLFDAVSALCGLCLRAAYDGQAPMLLEAARRNTEERYEFALRDGMIISAGIFAGVLADVDKGLPASEISGRFHNTVVELILACSIEARRRRGLNTVYLAGGSFLNRFIFTEAQRRLAEVGFAVRVPQALPPNDASVAVGQVMVACRRQDKPSP